MKILNALEELPDWDATTEEGLSILLRLLSPIAPHIAHHLWRELKFGDDVMQAPWPQPDAAALEQDEIELVVQVNGKLRGSIRVPKAAGRGEIEQLARANPNVQRFVAGQGVNFVPTTVVQLTRDVTYNDADILAKESEEQLLFRDMQSDMVQQVMRRLAAVERIKPKAE